MNITPKPVKQQRLSLRWEADYPGGGCWVLRRNGRLVVSAQTWEGIYTMALTAAERLRREARQAAMLYPPDRQLDEPVSLTFPGTPPSAGA